MKTIRLLFVCMLVAIFAHAQDNVPPYVIDVEVTPPKFTAVKYTQANDDSSLKAYISQNFQSNGELTRVSEGTEVVQFVIDPEGRVSDITIVNSVSPEVDDMITAILEETDRMWIPGKNNGVPVAMEKELAIQVKLGMTESAAEKRDFTEIAEDHFTNGAEKLFFDQKTRKAKRSFETAIRYKPYDQGTLYMLALCEMDLGNKNEAQAYVDRIQKLGGNPEILEERLAQDIKNVGSYEQLSALFATK
ncbi:energy transducer TonB [Draconibacterium sp. IB214405]|uniref:energy transducer TonB n=1 Tax=Draconibacterium sp. IB214405 TaxID=3097352 RepID=UPI002A0D8DF4|nr:energy transducer TonB [Draconibacterium sp. IB214405]MDX8338852.1 energy transducer TonB [Draconibacterium sp. IB214405]